MSVRHVGSQYPPTALKAGAPLLMGLEGARDGEGGEATGCGSIATRSGGSASKGENIAPWATIRSSAPTLIESSEAKINDPVVNIIRSSAPALKSSEARINDPVDN
jgi:hypothetical protein